MWNRLCILTLNWVIPRSTEMWANSGGGWGGVGKQFFLTCNDLTLRRNFLLFGNSLWYLKNRDFSNYQHFLCMILHTGNETIGRDDFKCFPLWEGTTPILYKNISHSSYTILSSHWNANTSILQTPAPAELFCVSNSKAVWGKKIPELPK